MKSKLLTDAAEQTWVVVFDTGDELMSGLLSFAKEKELAASHFTAIGAFSGATLGYFDLKRKDYLKIPIDEQVEVLSLVGDITLDGNDPKIHAHSVVGYRDGTTRGGHVLDAHVRPTLEVMLVESPLQLQRATDNETGLALIDL